MEDIELALNATLVKIKRKSFKNSTDMFITLNQCFNNRDINFKEIYKWLTYLLFVFSKSENKFVVGKLSNEKWMINSSIYNVFVLSYLKCINIINAWISYFKVKNNIRFIIRS